VPELEFCLDSSMEYGARIDSVLKQIKPELGAEKQK
jgi:ribosome-binding factor A